MTKKIFRSIFSVSVLVLCASLVITVGFLYDYFNRLQIERLREELVIIKGGVEESGSAFFDGFNSDVFRFTLVSPDGEVIYDSKALSDSMDNHIDREEIDEALKYGSGSSARYSSTLTERTFYEAVRLENGNVLRISATQVTIASLIIGMLPAICAVVLFSVILAIVLSQKMAKSIVKPLEKLDLDNPERNDTYEELTPVLSRLNRQHRQILRQMRQLKQKSDEFEQITSSMSEGLILTDKNGNVISINSAAKKIFATDGSVAGNSFLTLERHTVYTALKRALNGIHSDFTEERNGGEYRFLINPTLSDGRVIGAVIICIDITESARSERNRQEFTANVSHELKTPLQSIVGSAELLENGLVKPEDEKRFLGNIKSEALRLVELINDIIRLSQLDEGATFPDEEVDLYEIASEAVKSLSNAAEKKNITLLLEGENCVMRGVRRYLYEIVYNLCDNAVRYNKDGGRVCVSIMHKNGVPTISVADTGIGIPPEHRNRIFERFYRVDKSHSRETGGTGLGLSIVKHAVACHGGTVSLDSTVGVGTTVTVTF